MKHIGVAHLSSSSSSTELGPHIRRAFYHELLPHPELLVPLFTHGQPATQRALFRAGFPMLRVAMRRRFQISPHAAANSRAKMVAALDRLEREISTSGYLVGDSFTVADLTAAALFYGVVRPPEFPYPMAAHDDLPDSWREFIDPLAQRPGGRWIAETYRRHRGRSAELTTGDSKRAPRPDAGLRQSTADHEAVSSAETASPKLAPPHARIPARRMAMRTMRPNRGRSRWNLVG